MRYEAGTAQKSLIDVSAPKPIDERRTEALVSIARTARALLLVLISAALFWLLADIVLLIFAAGLIAVALRGISDALARHTRFTPAGALVVVITISFMILVLLGFWFGPAFADEFSQLGGAIQKAFASAQARYGHTAWGQALLGMKHNIADGHATLIGTSAASVVMGTLGSVGSLFLVFVTGLYIAGTPGLYLEGMIRLLPLPHRERGREIVLEIGHVLRWWMLGQLVDMLAVGVLASVGLSLLHVPMALALGVLAGLLTFIPYVGAFIAAVPGIVVALTVSLPTVFWVIVIYLACHGIEGYVISPIVTRRTVHLPPALTVFSMAVLGVIYGGFGIVIATPITAAGLVLFREIYVADVLGDRSHEPLVSPWRGKTRRDRC